MKYWILRNGHIDGPYDPSDLWLLPGYSAQSIVCPEILKGTTAGDWQRAGVIPELAVSFLTDPWTAAMRSVPPVEENDGAPAAEPASKDAAAPKPQPPPPPGMENACPPRTAGTGPPAPAPTPPPAPVPLAASPPAPQQRLAPIPQAPPPLFSPPPEDLPDIAENQVPPKKPGKNLIIAALLIAALGVGAAFHLGLIPGAKKDASQSMPDQAPLPPAEPSSDEAQLEERKRQAIALVRQWPSAESELTVGQKLEAGTPAAESLPPWMAERLTDESFAVNFYSAKAGPDERRTIYEFEARLGERKVIALNGEAKALLLGKPHPANMSRVLHPAQYRQGAPTSKAASSRAAKAPKLPGYTAP